MTQLNELTTPCLPNFCPGCGNFGIMAAFKNAAVKAGWDNTNTALFAGIGCHGHILNFMKITGFESLHGRSVPVATGCKLANHQLNVFVFTGDGDCLAEGGNHFIHTARRNHDITLLLHDNAIYGLTTGQTSPRTPKGAKTKSTPQGNIDEPFNPVRLALAAGAGFIARGVTTDIEKLTELIIKANEHKGFALVDILQPCVTFNKEYSADFYKQNCYYVPESYDPSDKQAAFVKSMEWGEKQIPLGILYQDKAQSYEEQVKQISEKPLVETAPVVRSLDEVFKKYM